MLTETKSVKKKLAPFLARFQKHNMYYHINYYLKALDLLNPQLFVQMHDHS